MRLPRLVERESAINADLELPGGDPGEEIIRAPQRLLARGDVMYQCRTGQEERAPRVQYLRIERCHRPAGLPKEDHIAAWSQTIQAGVERVFTYRVVDHGEA